MLQRMTCALWLICCVWQASAQDEFPNAVVPATGWGMTYVSPPGASLWSVSGLAVQLSEQELPAIGISQSMRYGLPELSTTTIAGAGVIGNTSIATALSRSGPTSYRLLSWRMALVRSLTPQWRCGLSAGFLWLRRYENYRGIQSLILLPSMEIKIRDGLTLLAGWNRPGFFTKKSKDDRTPHAGLITGLLFRGQGPVTFCLEWSKPWAQRPSLNTGLAWKAKESVVLYLGRSSQPGTICTGISLHHGSMLLNMAIQMHTVLGASPACGVLFSNPETP
ncbi:MAG: hypothetical protein KDD36_09045 [Flavobacteriales bacterium]|nr:hypothetical protein [Flavobacteriales bacterium]